MMPTADNSAQPPEVEAMVADLEPEMERDVQLMEKEDAAAAEKEAQARHLVNPDDGTACGSRVSLVAAEMKLSYLSHMSACSSWLGCTPCRLHHTVWCCIVLGVDCQKQPFDSPIGMRL